MTDKIRLSREEIELAVNFLTDRFNSPAMDPFHSMQRLVDEINERRQERAAELAQVIKDREYAEGYMSAHPNLTEPVAALRRHRKQGEDMMAAAKKKPWTFHDEKADDTRVQALRLAVESRDKGEELALTVQAAEAFHEFLVGES